MRDRQDMKRELNAALEAPKMSFNVAVFKACMMAGDIFPEGLDNLAKGFPEEVAFFKRWKQYGMDISDGEITV